MSHCCCSMRYSVLRAYLLEPSAGRPGVSPFAADTETPRHGVLRPKQVVHAPSVPFVVGDS